MKVKILIGMAGIGFVYQAGGVYDIPPGEADRYIKAGRAEAIEEPKQQKVIVQRVRKAKKR